MENNANDNEALDKARQVRQLVNDLQMMGRNGPQ